MNTPNSILEQRHPIPDGTVLDEIYCTVGKKLTVVEVQQPEAALVADEWDLKSRLKLLGYYFNLQDRLPEAGERQKHVLWMIHHRPDDYVCSSQTIMFSPKLKTFYAETKLAWEAAIKANPNNAAVIGNAGCSLAVLAPAIAREYLAKAVKLDPDNYNFSLRLQGLQTGE